MRCSVLWIILGVSVLLSPFKGEAKTIFEVPDNIVENPSAEEIGGDMPLKWGRYVGNGSFKFGFTDEEAHSGKYSAYLTVLALGENDGLNAAIMVGDTNGYDGARAYECKEKTEYFYAFYAKAKDPNDFKAPLRVLLWCWKEGFTAKDRVFPPLTNVTLTSEWKRYEGSFVTPEGAKRCALGIGPFGRKAAEVGATFYLDDVYLGLTPPPSEKPRGVDPSDKLAALWGRIKSR